MCVRGSGPSAQLPGDDASKSQAGEEDDSDADVGVGAHHRHTLHGGDGQLGETVDLSTHTHTHTASSKRSHMDQESALEEGGDEP